MKNLINRVRTTYSLENIRYMYSIRPVATVLAITADVLIVAVVVVAVGSVVVYGIGTIV